MRMARLLPLFVGLLLVSRLSAQAHDALPGATYDALEGGPRESISLSSQDDALVILSTLDLSSFHGIISVIRNNGGEVPQAYPPNAFVAKLNPGAELALRRHPAVARLERGVVDPASLTVLGGQAELAAHVWNTVFRGVPDPIAAGAPSGPPPERQGPDFLIPPPEAPGERTVPGAPTSTQTSEFMAGTVVYSVVFVESSGGTGYCSPADPQTENWDQSRRNAVLSEIGAGLSFWTARSNRPSPLTFVLDDRGTQPTSCEPISRPAGGSSSDEPKWIADVLKAMGRSGATPSNYYSEARAYAASRRATFGADWGYLIFVVDSLNDGDGMFSNGYFAYAYLNGPLMVMTYDNDNWGIGDMDLVTAHETGHIFGALDEYASSQCSTSDSWGYLNVRNASCNNGGITSDYSIMGEWWEQVDPSVDVSTSARGAIGWRNPAGAIVDVVRTATVSLAPYAPDPTPDNTPTYSASGGNTPFPPEGPRIYHGYNYGTASPVTVSKVAGAEWNLDGGAFTSLGVVPNDGAFDEEAEPYSFTPQSPVANGTHTFGTRSSNNFGHISSVATDTLTIAVTSTPDLIETAVSNPPASQNRGTSFSVTDTAKNQGGQQAGPSYTRYYLSLDTVRNTGDKLLTGKRSVPVLAPGATSTGTKSVTIPGNTALGTYYLLACADDTLLVIESDETNNCIASASTIQVTAPDLRETALTNPPASVKQGGSFNVTDTTANVGTGPAGASTTQYYLSLDKIKSLDDRLLNGSRAVPALLAGASSSGTVLVTVPVATPLGTYFLLACADDLKAVKFEIKEGNNCRASVSKVQVTAP